MELNINKLDHVAIVSADAVASRKWYQSVLGMEWVFQGKWDNYPFFLQKGDAYLAIFQQREQPGDAPVTAPRIAHFAFRADTMMDFEAAREILSGKGIPFNEEDHGISRSLYLKDPDGLNVEITTYDLQG